MPCMLRESHEISAEERMGRDLFNSRVDAFHTKITTSALNSGVLPKKFILVSRKDIGSDGEVLFDYVVPDDVIIPPEIELVRSIQFDDGAAVDKPWQASMPPYEWYVDVHAHKDPTAHLGGIPVKPVKIE